MKNFIYNTPTKVYFGKGQENNIGTILKDYKVKKVLLHYGKSSVKKSGLLDKIITKLNEESIEFIELGGVEPNPKLSLVFKSIILYNPFHLILYPLLALKQILINSDLANN